MVALTYIVATLVLLGLCIYVHELGHLLGGKLVGIKARTFSLGFGNGIIFLVVSPCDIKGHSVGDGIAVSVKIHPFGLIAGP